MAKIIEGQIRDVLIEIRDILAELRDSRLPSPLAIEWAAQERQGSAPLGDTGGVATENYQSSEAVLDQIINDPMARESDDA